MKYILRLKKSLYDLKDTAFIWNQTLENHFTNVGLTEMQSDPWFLSKEKLIVMCYVDGLILFRKTIAILENFEVKLGIKFILKNLWRLKQVLGIELHWSTSRTVHMKHTNIAKTLLEKKERLEVDLLVVQLIQECLPKNQ